MKYICVNLIFKKISTSLNACNVEFKVIFSAFYAEFDFFFFFFIKEMIGITQYSAAILPTINRLLLSSLYMFKLFYFILVLFSFPPIHLHIIYFLLFSVHQQKIKKYIKDFITSASDFFSWCMLRCLTPHIMLSLSVLLFSWTFRK